MASTRKEISTGSDSYKETFKRQPVTYTTPVAEELVNSLKPDIIQCFSRSEKCSAQILHVEGHPAKMVVSLGESKVIPQQMKTHTPKPTKRILVENLPPAADKEFLQMFFEYEKGKGGGQVKNITFIDHHSAVVEFQDALSVEVVLIQRPIQMLGIFVKVEPHFSYFDHNESLGSIEFNGLPSGLTKEIENINLKRKHLKIKIGDYVRLKRSVECPVYGWGTKGMSYDLIGLVKSIRKDMIYIDFPGISDWKAIESELERVYFYT